MLTEWLVVLVFKYLSRKVSANIRDCDSFLRGSSVVIFSVTFSATRCIIWLWASPKNVKDDPWFYHVHCWSLQEYHHKYTHLFQWVKCSLCLYIARKCSQMSFVVEHGRFLKFVMLENKERMLWLSLPAARINTWIYQSICFNQQEMFINEKVLIFCIVHKLYIFTMCLRNTVLLHCLRLMPCGFLCRDYSVGDKWEKRYKFAGVVCELTPFLSVFRLH